MPSAQEEHGEVGDSPEETLKDDQHLSYKETWRELGLVNLEKKRFQENLITAYQFLKNSTEKPEKNSLSGYVTIRHEVMVSN